MTFTQKLKKAVSLSSSLVCVGLDSRFDKLPAFLKTKSAVSKSIFLFNRAVIESTADIVACYKMNLSFYYGFGEEGIAGLKQTNTFLKKYYPWIPIIADCKRSEMGESVKMVKQEIFDWLGFDCVMATPWFGFDTIAGYLLDQKHGVCIYTHNSNPSAPEFQDLTLKNGLKLYEFVAQEITEKWNKNGNVFVEVGATYPKQLRRIRKIIGEEMFILAAGIGSQGATVSDLKGCFGFKHQRLLVSSSRGIIFAGKGSRSKQDYFKKVREATLKLQRDISLTP